MYIDVIVCAVEEKCRHYIKASKHVFSIYKLIRIPARYDEMPKENIKRKIRI